MTSFKLHNPLQKEEFFEKILNFLLVPTVAREKN
jgi:hypothetical protein